MVEDFKSHAADLFRRSYAMISEENRPLTPEELEQVYASINILRSGNKTSVYLESPIREGVALLHDHFRIKFGLPRGTDYAGLLEYTRDKQPFAGLNPTWESREPADVEFMAFGQLGVYDHALAGHLEIP